MRALLDKPKLHIYLKVLLQRYLLSELIGLTSGTSERKVLYNCQNEQFVQVRSQGVPWSNRCVSTYKGIVLVYGSRTTLAECPRPLGRPRPAPARALQPVAVAAAGNCAVPRTGGALPHSARGKNAQSPAAPALGQ